VSGVTLWDKKSSGCTDIGNNWAFLVQMEIRILQTKMEI
jgi:hypothetical protein